MVESEQKATPRRKSCAHPQKIMLCIWWNSEGVLYNEFLYRGVTINAGIYCQQVRRLADAFQEKRPTRLREVMLLHDNARPRSSNLTETLYRSWVGKSFRTHLIYLIMCPQIFTSPSNNLRGTSFRKLTTSLTQNDAFSTGLGSRNYSSVSRML